MATKNAIKQVLLTHIDAATLDATWRPINPLGLTAACFMLRITNASGNAVELSFDGVNADEWLPVFYGLKLPVQRDKDPVAGVALWPKGKIVYARDLSGQNAGNIYLSGYYQ